MIRHLIALAVLAATAGTFFAANPPRGAEKKASAAAQLPESELNALAAATAAYGWINLLRDPALTEWQRVSLPPETPLDARNPWRYDRDTGVLHCDGTGLHEMLLERTERGDGIFYVEWRYAGAPAKPNSGIFVRTKPDNSIWHRADLAPKNLGMLSGAKTGLNGKTGRFNSGRRRPELLKKGDEWNVTELVCVGSRVMLHVNGVITAEMAESAATKGFVGLEADGAPLEFRALKFKPIP